MKSTFYATLLIIAGIIIYGFFIEPYSIEVHHLRMEETSLPLKGLTIMQLSDLHIKGIGPREKEVLKIIKEIKPDIIFLTGDYVTWDGDYEQALDFLLQIKARIGVWAVMGDYDYSNTRKGCLFCHEPGTGAPTKRHNVRFLKNSSAVVPLPEGNLYLYGIDETADSEMIIKETPAIVLSHHPLNFNKIKKDKDIFMLSGDTHGGQIPLTAWLWRIVGYDKNAEYNHGLFKEGKKAMYVSRGIGTSHVPFRFCKRPEIVVMDF
jgi:uncharacterized protein